MPHPTRFGIQVPEQNGNWKDILRLWQEADTLQFDTAWVFDHFLPIFSDPSGPCLEGWTSLAALAIATKRIRLGVMVTGNTYRHPAILAKMATTIDIVSEGRLIPGMGSGWFQLEHEAYDIEFPKIGDRLIALDESITLIKQLWTEDRTTFTGWYHHIRDAPFEPKPIQKPYPPILIGAGGEKIALGIVARHADMWNTFGTPETFRKKIQSLEAHCKRIGRDIDDIEKSVLITTTASADHTTRKLIDDYLRVGVTHIVFSLPASTEASQLRRFARDISLAA